MSRVCHPTAPYLVPGWNTVASKRWKVPSLVGGSESTMRIPRPACPPPGAASPNHTGSSTSVPLLLESRLILVYDMEQLTKGNHGRYEWKLSLVEASPDFSYQRYAGFTGCAVLSADLQNPAHGWKYSGEPEILLSMSLDMEFKTVAPPVNFPTNVDHTHARLLFP